MSGGMVGTGGEWHSAAKRLVHRIQQPLTAVSQFWRIQPRCGVWRATQVLDRIKPAFCLLGRLEVKMTSLRKHKSQTFRSPRYKRWLNAQREERLWDQMPAVGREFGSPDFERLMEEDYRKGVGVFDPALKDQWKAKRAGQST